MKHLRIMSVWFCIIIIVYSFPATGGTAEWTSKNPLSQRNCLFDVWSSSGSDVFAVGDSAAILHYDGNSWTVMTSGTTNNLKGVWGASGLDVYTVGQSGTLLHYVAASASPPVYLVADFGASGGNGGIHGYNVADGWFQIASSDPAVMLATDIDADGTDELYAGFASGLSVFSNGIWTLLTPSVPQNIIVYNDGMAIDFGVSGLWTYNGAEWDRLTTSDAEVMTSVNIDGTGDDELAATFSGSGGVFLYNDSVWSRLTTTVTENIISRSKRSAELTV